MLELISQFIVEIVLEKIIYSLFKGIKWIGLIGLKLITLSPRPMNELKEKYKDSCKPYFVAFGILTVLLKLYSKC